ncbi:MAG: hypothetical protein A3E01_09385 [Gammaproteobacteria bacterium RIFCSPHIGHO2_12_FULL_63_22]|nr:MAG: hypothetical protein A3E01_09385 [Gammaproteobacteria bacterium RIFCSPHIGHO2_12_FULL_63_22]
MAGSENKTKADALTETVEALRAEINDLKNKPGHADELAALRADLQTVKDELAAAKAKPAPEPGNGKEKTPPATVTEDKPRERFGFW